MHISSGAWWRTRILSAHSLADLRESLTMIAQRIGFRHFVFRGRYSKIRSGHNEIRLDNCPAGWFDYCSEHGFATAPDPMHHRAMQEATPVLWRDWISHYPAYFAAARKFGLITGVTHAVYGPLGDQSSISFMKGVGGIEAEREIVSALSECQLIACYAHQMVARAAENGLAPENPGAPPPKSAPALTERERECLMWVATGKTAAQVAATLALSEATIIYHLTKARRKLDASNSRHAISKAISMKLIALN
ncbi:MAG TPA: LuxR family transcriptional regulator [Burkholderiales bacterium]|nr:LuxR family transcriptional regulator [Burkholderiales bacterium]